MFCIAAYGQTAFAATQSFVGQIKSSQSVDH